MIFVAVMVLGLYSSTKLPIDLYPEMEMPAISIMTAYPGASAEDIEENITKIIEDGVNIVENVKDITSSSKDNISTVSIEFEWGTDLDGATNDIRDAIDRIFDDLPEGCDRPTIFKFSTNMMPIMMYSITAKESYSGIDKLIEDKIVNPLNRVNGVASIFINGAPERIIYINTDAKKLDAYNLTIEQIGQTIQTANLDLPAGSVRMGRLDYQLRVEGEFNESSEIADLVVGSYNGRNVYVKDVAVVNDTIKDVMMSARSNGQQGLNVIIMKQSGSNTVGVAQGVKKRLKELAPSLPKDVQINEIFDSSSFIQNAIGNLSETIMFALIFVIAVVLLFLGRWRATLIIALTIPISLIVSFIYLFFTGSSINIISLSSLSIAIGLVVDDAIVVLENITKHIERGSRPREAAIYATNEVWVSIIAATMTIVAVFLPLTTLDGMVGILFKELGWIVTITIVTSAVAAITIVPMLSAYLLKLRDKEQKLSWFAKFHERYIQKWLDALDRFYERMLHLAMRNKKKVIFSMFAIFVASMFLFKFIGMDFMPQTDEGRFQATIELATGYRVEETLKTTEALENLLRERYPEVRIISSTSGADDEAGFSALFGNNATNTVSLTVRLADRKDRTRSVFEIVEDFRQQLKKYPQIITSNVTVSGGMMSGGGSDNSLKLEVYGYDLDETYQVAEKIKALVTDVPGARDITISRKKDKPELQVNFDKEKLAQHQLSVAQAATMLRNRVNGLIATQFREAGEEYKVIVRLDESYRNSIDNVEDITLTTPQGKHIKLSEIGTVREYWAPPNIERKQRQRVLSVSITPVGVSLGQLATSVQERLDKDLKIPSDSDIMIDYAGSYEDQQESFADMGLLMALIILLVFVVMASQFESLLQPLVIMSAVLFAFTGVALSLFITGTYLNMIAALGAILLIGIVVKNGIVLVDYTNLMRERGHEISEAVALAGKSRLRPVLMTSLTTILGMLPMALSSGDGSEIWAPMGVVVIGGMTISTVVTLVVVPLLYAVVSRRGERNKNAKIRKDYKFLEQ
jgi:HAE1 family hydrophobic/amphiphilic exporter-1